MDEENSTRPVSIPHELISEILTRLPVKSLTRFRSVSTQWNSTIAHPSFTKSHSFRSTSGARVGAPVTLILTFINRFNSERTIFSVTIPSDPSDPVPNPTRILTIPGFKHPFVSQPLNGLICFNLGSMCVCNPSTRKFINLPWTQPKIDSPSLTTTRHRTNAFGFDPVSNTHKVLDTWITCHENDMIMEQRVFVIGSGCKEWRIIENGTPYFPFDESICINGRICFRAYPSMLVNEKPVLVVFNVCYEEFRFIEMHDDAILSSEDSIMMELDGRLVIVDNQCVTSDEDSVLVMWMLMDEDEDVDRDRDRDKDEDKWVKKCVEVPAIYGEMNDSRRYKFAGSTLSGEMIFTERKLVDPFCVVLYDIKRNEVKRVEICGLTDFEFKFGHGVMDVTSVNEHVESIISLC